MRTLSEAALKRRTASDYAGHQAARIVENPDWRNYMARAKKTREAIEAELDEANEYIEELEGKLDDIAGIAGDEDEDDEAGEYED